MSTKTRLVTTSPRAISNLLNLFQKNLVSLRVEHWIIVDDVQLLTSAIRKLNRLERLYFLLISPIPLHIKGQLPTLMNAVRRLPKLKRFGYTPIYDAPLGPQIAASFAKLTRSTQLWNALNLKIFLDFKTIR